MLIYMPDEIKQAGGDSSVFGQEGKGSDGISITWKNQSINMRVSIYMTYIGVYCSFVVEHCEGENTSRFLGLKGLVTMDWMEGALQIHYWGEWLDIVEERIDCLEGLWQLYWTPKKAPDPLNSTKSSLVAGLREILLG